MNDDETEIKWEAPPSSRAGARRAWADRLAPLRDRPGEWANVGRNWQALASNITRGRIAGIPAGEYEAVARNSDRATGACDVYVRYIGHLANGHAED